MSRLKYLAAVAFGVLSALAVGEGALRLFEGYLPRPSPWPTMETELKHQQLSSGEHYDIVFLGSSVTEAAVDPSLLEGSAYNAALPFSSPISLEPWFEGEFGSRNPPTVVVLGLPVWPSHDALEFDGFATPLVEAYSSNPELEPVRLLRNRGVLADWFDLRLRTKPSVAALWTPGGHQTLYYQRKGESLAGRFPPYGTPAMTPEIEAAIRLLASSVESNGSRFVMMIEPGRFPGEVDPDEIHVYLQSLEDLADDLGVPFWDTYSLPWDASWFADEAHFNRRGTEEFTALIGRLLAALDVG